MMLLKGKESVFFFRVWPCGSTVDDHTHDGKDSKKGTQVVSKNRQTQKVLNERILANGDRRERIKQSLFANLSAISNLSEE